MTKLRIKLQTMPNKCVYKVMNKGRDNKLLIEGYEQIVEICMAIKKDFSGGLGDCQN